MEHTQENLPTELKTLIVDSDHVFLCRIRTEPITTETGIANVIPQGIDRQSRDYTIRITEELVRRWNSQPDLLKACKDVAEIVEGEPMNSTTLLVVERAIAKAE